MKSGDFLGQLARIGRGPNGIGDSGRPTVIAAASQRQAQRHAAGALEVEPEVGEQTDFSVFSEQAEQLLKELEHYNEEEAQLIEDNILQE